MFSRTTDKYPALFVVLLVVSASAAGQSHASLNSQTKKPGALQLIELAQGNSSLLRDAITAAFNDQALKAGTAWMGHGHDFFFATVAETEPKLVIDGANGPSMQRLAGSSLWYSVARIEQLGSVHSFY